jgi:(E)-4-hydroxy-3-methylbut-2-enyl-diphosphate synthase
MGCAVNGPGEAKEADIGIAFGNGNGVIFKQGKKYRAVKTKDAVDVLCDEIRALSGAGRDE